MVRPVHFAARMCGMGFSVTVVPLDDTLRFIDRFDLEPVGWAYPVAWALSLLAAGVVILLLVLASLGARDWWRSSRGVPIDAGRFPRTHEALSDARSWRGLAGAVLREHGRAALSRVFGTNPWRTFLAERAIRGRATPGVAPRELRAWVSVYLDAAARHVETGAVTHG